MRRQVIKVLATFFYLGYSPLIPGTLASLGAMSFYFLAKDKIPLYIFFLFLFGIIGFFVCGEAELIFKERDSKKIVIDEAFGVLIAFFLLPLKGRDMFLAFFLFRLLDGLKPYPANLLQHLRGSWGIMLDDVFAGIYTNLSIQALLRLIAWRAS